MRNPCCFGNRNYNKSLNFPYFPDFKAGYSDLKLFTGLVKAALSAW